MEGDSYPLDSVPATPAAEIAAAWWRERPGVPVSSAEIVTLIWRLAKLLADDSRRVLQVCYAWSAAQLVLPSSQRSLPATAPARRFPATRPPSGTAYAAEGVLLI